jgi:predicted nucleic acid-binding protein
MKVILDTNVLMSAFIKNGATRKALVTANLDFYYPEAAFHEVRRHTKLILHKSRMSDIELKILIGHLMSAINLVPDEMLMQHLDEAMKTLGQVDPDDVVFLAAALCFPDAVIWSDDAHLQKQDLVPINTSKEMLSGFS